MRCKIWNYSWYSCFLMLWLNLIPSVNYLHTILDVAKFLQKSNSIKNQNVFIFKIMIFTRRMRMSGRMSGRMTNKKPAVIHLTSNISSIATFIGKQNTDCTILFMNTFWFSLQWIDTQCQWGELSKPKTKLHGRPG